MRSTSTHRLIDTPASLRTWARAGLGAAVALALLGTAACTEIGKDSAGTNVAGTVHMCSSCHGPEGQSVSPTFPRLAGQQQNYIATQLKAFRDHTRADPHAHTYMWGMAAHLSDATIDGLAAYYVAQKPAAGTPGDPTLMAAGKKIYEEGIPSKNVPACTACHGAKAEGNGPIPRLAGQHRNYLEQQLDAFASNARANEIMHENSKNLTPQQASEAAAYLAAQ
jgi:cytochrome c553